MKRSRERKIDVVSKEERSRLIQEIIGFFQDERGEQIGVVGAEKVLEFFLNTLGEEVYRKALKDAKKLCRERFEDLDMELDLLLGD